MMDVILTDRAKESLDEIVKYYLIEFTQSRAEKVAQSLYDAFDEIGKAPYRHPLCFDVDKPQMNIRQIVVHSTYRVIYRIQVDKIEIIEIFHGSRNEKLLKDIY